MRKLIFIFLLTSITLYSQSTNDDFNKLDWIQGSWTIINNENKNIEIWEKVSPYKLIGKSIIITNGDTTTKETIIIELIENKILYKATVPDQNEGKEIIFENKEINSNTVSFENINHDFPQTITYKQITKEDVLVILKGKQKDNSNLEITIFMKKEE